MSLLEQASAALKTELDATDEEVLFLFRTYAKSLEASLAQIQKNPPTRPFLKPLLHKLKGEAFSLNLDHFAIELEILESKLLEEHDPSHLTLVTTITALIQSILVEIQS